MVKVVKHPETGNVLTPSVKNAEWGTLRVDSSNKSFTNGMFNISNRTAFIRGKIVDLESMNFKDGQSLPGKIQKQESFEPFYDGQDPKINPTTGEIILTNGKESFIQFVYTEDANALDVWVGATTVEVAEEVQEALAGQAV